MGPSARGWIFGGGCGCLTVAVTVPTTIAVVMGLAWFTWEAHVQHFVSGPVSIGLGLILGVVLGFILGLMVTLMIKGIATGDPEA